MVLCEYVKILPRLSSPMMRLFPDMVNAKSALVKFSFTLTRLPSDLERSFWVFKIHSSSQIRAVDSRTTEDQSITFTRP